MKSKSVLWAVIFFTSHIVISHSAFCAKQAKEMERDPKQLSVFVFDIDETLFHNLGNYRLRRVSEVQAITPFFTDISSLPEEIEVPVHDYEGNTGVQIQKRIGHLDEKGKFVPSTSLEPVQLSNGQTIVPGYYYFDLQSSLKEFRPTARLKNSHFVEAIDEKIQSKERFLLDAFGFLSLASDEKFSGKIQTVLNSMRGHSVEEINLGLKHLFEAMGKKAPELCREACATLTNPYFYEFAASKVNYLKSLFHSLTNRMMQIHTTPHFLIKFENDRTHLKNIDQLFRSVADQGVFANPVVPILVNFVEEEVLKNPDGIDWDRSPQQKLTKMSRVTIYRPGKVERYDSFSKVLEVVLGLEAEEAKELLEKNNSTPFSCSQRLARGAK